MPETPLYGLPYPPAVGVAPDVPYYLQQLAEAVEAVLSDDTGWMVIPIGAGFSALSASEPPQIRRRGDTVYFQGGWAPGGFTANANHDVGTIPVGYRPTQNLIIPAGSSAGNVTSQAFVRSDGQVQIRTGATVGSYYKLTLTWLLN